MKKCSNCGKEEHHAKGFCTKCYKKLSWKPRIIICKRCHKERGFHTQDLCKPCYNFIYRSKYNKEWNMVKSHNIDIELYKKITKECLVCGLDKIVDLHHIDCNHKNNSEENLVGLCPNHHKMYHEYRYRDEILQKLAEKGVKVPSSNF